MFRHAATAVVFCLAQAARAQYVDGAVCAGCHPAEAAKWRGTGMARSFNKNAPRADAAYYHAPSDIYYEMFSRGGEYFQRQYQKDAAGRAIHERESRVDYVLGSGNHSRAFLHRTPDNALIELPLAWYAENGGTWAMNPGYDRPDHDGLRRKIGYECMFCHNGYPDVSGVAARTYPAGMPEGIDCQRCHGQGGAHVRARGGRGTIVNPARLSRERQTEICMQCHLETTSQPLPNALVRYGRDPFSFRPGEPLTDFRLHFERKGAAPTDEIEINSSAYRLRQSQCFLKSGDGMTCTTCHDPHQAKGAVAQYDAACQSCHRTGLEKHAAKENCAGCHMAKRNTADVIHAVMTDHRIEKRPRATVAVKSESQPAVYRGELAPYLGGHDELHLAAAQVVEDSNLKAGLAQFLRAVERLRPDNAGVYLDLADGLRRDGRCRDAAKYYAEAQRRGADTARKAALCLAPADAITALRNTKDADALTQRGIAHAAAGRRDEALAALRRAVQLDATQMEAWNAIGGLLMTSQPREAEDALHQALTVHPNYPEAWNNLGGLQSNGGRIAEARRSFEAALRYRPGDSSVRYNYAAALLQSRDLAGARRQLETLLASDAGYAAGHELLGVALGASNDLPGALEHFRAAVRLQPDSARARLRLGEALAQRGDVGEAAQHLRVASESRDAAVSGQAKALMQQLRIQ